MARVKFIKPADFDRVAYEERVKAFMASGKYAEASAVMDILEKVDAMSVPEYIPDGFDIMEVLPEDPDAFLRKKDGGEKSSGGVTDLLVDGKDGNGVYVVTISISRLTDDQKRDWDLK